MNTDYWDSHIDLPSHTPTLWPDTSIHPDLLHKKSCSLAPSSNYFHLCSGQIFTWWSALPHSKLNKSVWFALQCYKNTWEMFARTLPHTWTHKWKDWQVTLNASQVVSFRQSWGKGFACQNNPSSRLQAEAYLNGFQLEFLQLCLAATVHSSRGAFVGNTWVV